MIPLAILLLIGLLLVVAAAIAQLSAMLLHPPRMTDGKAMAMLRRMSPADLGLAFEPCSFDVVDEVDGSRLKIAVWWMPAGHASTRTCILIHGYGDAKVGAIAWAPMFHDLGWNLLAIDLRAHGESGGTACTGGDRESSDLVQVIAQLRATHATETKALALFGVSLGGAVALAAAAREEVQVDAVIAESVFSDFFEAAKTHARLIGAPARSLHDWSIRFGAWRAGARIDRVRPAETARIVRCPIMVIHGEEDPFVPREQREAMAAAIASRNDRRDDHFVVSGAGHCLGMVADPVAYRARIERFLCGLLAESSGEGSASQSR